MQFSSIIYILNKKGKNVSSPMRFGYIWMSKGAINAGSRLGRKNFKAGFFSLDGHDGNGAVVLFDDGI